MDKLPNEMCFNILKFLCLGDLLPLSRVSKFWNAITKKLIWHKPRLRRIPLSTLLEMKDLPISILHTEDVAEFYCNHTPLELTQVIFLSSITTLQTLVLDHKKGIDFEELQYLSMLKNCRFVINSKTLHASIDWVNKNYVNTLLNMDAVVEFNSASCEYWTFEELNKLRGLRISYMESTSFCLYNIPLFIADYTTTAQKSQTNELISILTALNPDKIDLTRPGCCKYGFTRTQIKSMGHLNITGISTRVLDNTLFSPHPWLELKTLKTLKVIVLAKQTYVYPKHLEGFDIESVMAYNCGDWEEDILLIGSVWCMITILQRQKIWELVAETNLFRVLKETTIYLN